MYWWCWETQDRIAVKQVRWGNSDNVHYISSRRLQETNPQIYDMLLTDKSQHCYGMPYMIYRYMMWFGVIWFDFTWHDMTWHDTTRHNTTWNDTTRQDTTWYINIFIYIYYWNCTLWWMTKQKCYCYRFENQRYTEKSLCIQMLLVKKQVSGL